MSAELIEIHARLVEVIQLLELILEEIKPKEGGKNNE